MASVLPSAILLVLIAAFLPASFAMAAGVHPLFGLEDPLAGPFPSDRFTVPDDDQLTGRRVHLPKPDCAARVSDCEDIDVLNELDGFNVQPRLSIPFSGPIDVGTVSSETVFLLPFGGGPRIGINQVVWDVDTSTLHVESDDLLDQHTRYILIVTRDVRDAAGEPIEAAEAFQAFRHGQKVGQRDDDPAVTAYRDALLAGLEAAAAAGVDLNKVAVASVFTTMSVTAVLEKIRDQIRAADPPAPADFLLGFGPLGPDGKPTRIVRTVFPLDALAGMTEKQQVKTAPPNDFLDLSLAPRLALLRIIPGAVGTVAFGSYRSPVYLNAGRFIPQVGTRTGTPVVQGEDEVFFTLFLPAETEARPRPDDGWPVAIYGTGSGPNENKDNIPFNIAATLAAHGIATIAINAAGQGFGPLSTLTVRLDQNRDDTVDEEVTFSAGGRSLDLDDPAAGGFIGGNEGNNTPGPRRILRGRDPLQRQTIADLMQLVRVIIEVGIDVDGNHQLDPSRIYYVGLSVGASRGMAFAALEPSVRAAVLSVPGGPGGPFRRLSPQPPNRPADLGRLLASRVPPLLNPPGIVNLDGVAVGAPHFNENMPLREIDVDGNRQGVPLTVGLEDGTSQTIQSPVINTVGGAMEIQQVLERVEWVFMPADALAFAPYLRKSPLAGALARPLIVQSARGDQTLPNPGTTAMLRAGDLADRATFYFYRTDRAVAAFGAGPVLPPPTAPPGTAPPGVEKDGHNFLFRMNSPTRRAIARAAQEQVAVFFESDGRTVIDPNDVLNELLVLDGIRAPGDPPLFLFEVPIVRPLPEDLGFIP